MPNLNNHNNVYHKSKCYLDDPIIQRSPLVPLYSADTVRQIEEDWFAANNASYGLMQQAAWQSAVWIQQHLMNSTLTSEAHLNASHSDIRLAKICVWVGSGNNGGDGWLVASYLSQLGGNVTVIEVGKASTNDAKSAKKDAQAHGIITIDFSNIKNQACSDEAIADITQFIDNENTNVARLFNSHIFVDALFGIGLDRQPTGDYATAVNLINRFARSANIPVVSIDVPSGVIATTGQVFDGCAIKADYTVCLVARKTGLHLKDGQDYSGEIIDMALIPSLLNHPPEAYLQYGANIIPSRLSNTHKGSFGHVLIVGGNQVKGSQGMGGAAILAASSAFAVGVGKVTVACHHAFHGGLISSLPNAMCINLNDREGVIDLIKNCDVMAIGMGLARDEQSYFLFEHYVNAAIDAGVNMVIDADGLYHLSSLQETLKHRLVNHAKKHSVWYTPHSGEAARLLAKSVEEIEADRLAAIKQLTDTYQGSWLLKGAGSIVIDNHKTYVCAAGNAGMATAGMGDVLSGMSAGLMAQSALPSKGRSLQQAVMIHALAGDRLKDNVGQWALQAAKMPDMIGQIMQQITD